MPISGNKPKEKSMAAYESLGSWLAASMPYEAMTLQEAFCSKAPHETDFGQTSEAA